MSNSKEIGTASRRISVVSNHLIPVEPVPTGVDSLDLSTASSMNDKYHKVHGEVPTHQVVWRKADLVGDDGETKEFVDIIYEKAVGEDIAKVWTLSL